jgi:hypothetical protein
MSPDDAQMPKPSSDSAAPWIWSIGIYSGPSPLRLGPAPGARNPVLSARDVTDVPARFVADPFMLPINGQWHMFFEVLNGRNDRGEIGLATSRDGLAWQYRQIVLAEPFHLSYPYIFRWNQDFYMLPETLGAGAVRLYRAASFPTRWEHVTDLIPGTHADPSLFTFDNRWWLFTCPNPQQHDTLALYSTDSFPAAGPISTSPISAGPASGGRTPAGPASAGPSSSVPTPAGPASVWTEHPASPLIVANPRMARPAGRVLSCDGKLLRFTQDCFPIYGKQVRAFEITELTSATYKEREVRESPVLSPDGGGWNASGMHHIDAHRSGDAGWLACVDGLVDF